jgi:phosphoserine phosphatase RsbU/P
MEVADIKKQFEIKELELNALLEVTKAINENMAEDSLYKIYNFTLRSFLKKLALFVHEDEWSCKVHFGTTCHYGQVKLLQEFKTIQTITHLRDYPDCEFSEFDLIIPVAHGNKTLALVFVGGLDKSVSTDNPYGLKIVQFIQTLSNFMMVAMENKKLHRQQLEQEALRKELEIARDVQQFLFPEKLPNTSRLKVEASYLPHDRIGGDYYDYIPINKNQFLICVADVSGKGIPAALMMSNFQASLRTLIRQTPNLSDIIEALNYQVLQNTKGEKFITFFAAIYDVELKNMVYVNSGHNPPILWDRKKGIRTLEDGSTVLGAMHPLPFLNEGFIDNLEDFLLFCYTDGLTETINEKGKEFGFDNLLKYFQQDHVEHKKLKTIHQDIIVALDHHKGTNGYLDDITILSCRVE